MGPMPRSARLDMPGLLQHVMVRGIERRDIFVDDDDRRAFVGRLGELLGATQTELLAWALLSNHVHLLVRSRTGSLGTFMRRLLTGYAVTFNRRHERSGHLFQNRYKSVVCDEEPYLLELVRYIHLNPLRAGVVHTMEELERYPWTGHAVLLGRHVFEGQGVEEVLARFGRGVRQARARYREFVAGGIGQGRREELVGGGLRRSMAALGEEVGEEPPAFDDRVLGTGAFVEELRRHEQRRDRLAPTVPWVRLQETVAQAFGLDAAALGRRYRKGPGAQARAALCYLAVAQLGYKGAEVGRLLRLSAAGVSLAVRRGEVIVAHRPDLQAVAAQ